MENKNLLKDFFQHKSDANKYLTAEQQEELEKEFEAFVVGIIPTFDDVVRPVIKWLNDNMHPHAKVIVHTTGAECLEGVKITKEILEYVKD